MKYELRSRYLDIDVTFQTEGAALRYWADEMMLGEEIVAVDDQGREYGAIIDRDADGVPYVRELV